MWCIICLINVCGCICVVDLWLCLLTSFYVLAHLHVIFCFCPLCMFVPSPHLSLFLWTLTDCAVCEYDLHMTLNILTLLCFHCGPVGCCMQIIKALLHYSLTHLDHRSLCGGSKPLFSLYCKWIVFPATCFCWAVCMCGCPNLI